MPGLSSNGSIEGGEPLPPPESRAAIPLPPVPALLPHFGHYWPCSCGQCPALGSVRGSREHGGVWGPSPTTLGSVAVFELEEGKGDMQGWLAGEKVWSMLCPSPLCLAATCPSSGCGSSSWKQRILWGGKQGHQRHCSMLAKDVAVALSPSDGTEVLPSPLSPRAGEQCCLRPWCCPCSSQHPFCA